MCDKARRGEDGVTQQPGPSGNRRTELTNHAEEIEKLKSQVRLCVMRVLTERLNRPAGFSEVTNTVVTELILEYLEWMGYNRTMDTFRMECRLPKERNCYLLGQVAQQLCHKGDDILPLIFYIVKLFKELHK